MAASTGRRSTRDFIAAAVLSALIIVMTVVPYTGYIYYGLIEITTLHIVVAIGAVAIVGVTVLVIVLIKIKKRNTQANAEESASEE